MLDLMIATRNYREKLLSDPYRPGYHFAVPDNRGWPGDPNGAFYADGVYHLLYLYKNYETNGFHWGHMTSIDLVHWTNMPDALFPEEGNEGCFSGGAFVDDDKTAYITYWKFPTSKNDGGVAVACSKPPYLKWETMEPIAIESCKEFWGISNVEINGKTERLSCADPSNIWKMNGYYYMQSGNKIVLDEYGRNEDSDPYYKGDWTDLYRSKDLKKWEFVHRFYKNTHDGPDWPDETEDNMCPSFLPLYDAKINGNKTDKYLELFISHNKGAQYYIGSLKGETFIPEKHGRMSWKDKTYFAPEALLDDKGRQVIWAWLWDCILQDFENYGWSGVYSFPRCVWLEGDELRMAPVDELDTLQYNHHIPEIADDGKVGVRNGESFRMKVTFDLENADKAGFSVRVSDDGESRAEIYFDKKNSVIVFDAINCSSGRLLQREEAPFRLQDGEKLSIDLFVDKSVIEIYANERQAICRRAYPKDAANSMGVKLIGSKESIEKIDAWEMFPANAY